MYRLLKLPRCFNFCHHLTRLRDRVYCTGCLVSSALELNLCGREGYLAGVGRNWAVIWNQWQPWFTPDRTLDLEWSFRVVPLWVKIARFFYCHINQSLKMVCPRKWPDLGEAALCYPGNLCKGLTVEDYLLAAVPDAGQQVLHWRESAGHTSVYQQTTLIASSYAHIPWNILMVYVA